MTATISIKAAIKATTRGTTTIIRPATDPTDHTARMVHTLRTAPGARRLRMDMDRKATTSHRANTASKATTLSKATTPRQANKANKATTPRQATTGLINQAVSRRITRITAMMDTTITTATKVQTRTAGSTSNRYTTVIMARMVLTSLAGNPTTSTIRMAARTAHLPGIRVMGTPVMGTPVRANPDLRVRTAIRRLMALRRRTALSRSSMACR